ncbi:hypothetical protein E2C01_046640 [Portunus trituberculatus]|uniref:Uncharacterized protein n=1 Tax=Portunus trituberculatus TaxID=210409 RepID=A0A5B7G696_PORTR|nr:hypothetical protein [Portunus trituberculatus]
MFCAAPSEHSRTLKSPLSAQALSWTFRLPDRQLVPLPLSPSDPRSSPQCGGWRLLIIRLAARRRAERQAGGAQPSPHGQTANGPPRPHLPAPRRHNHNTARPPEFLPTRPPAPTMSSSSSSCFLSRIIQSFLPSRRSLSSKTRPEATHRVSRDALTLPAVPRVRRGWIGTRRKLFTNNPALRCPPLPTLSLFVASAIHNHLISFAFRPFAFQMRDVR